MAFIKIILAGSRMSFGDGTTSWQSRRNTRSMPTRSAILGMLSNTHGFVRGSQESTDLKAKIGTIKTTTPLYKTHREVDYQNAHYYHIDRISNRGNTMGNADNVQRWKEYLVEAKYMVLIHAEEEVLDDLMYYLRHPIYQIYLGRKCCPPSERILQEVRIFKDEEEEEVLKDFQKNVREDGVKLCICQ